jgi:hypothetical protein
VAEATTDVHKLGSGVWLARAFDGSEWKLEAGAVNGASVDDVAYERTGLEVEAHGGNGSPA